MESGRVPEKGPGEYRKSGIRASTEEGWIQESTGKGRIRASAQKVESVRVPEKCRIRASVKKMEIRASTGKVEFGRVPEKGLGEYRERVKSGRVPKMWNPGEYRRRVRVSTGKG